MKKLVWLLSMVMLLGAFSVNAQEKTIRKKTKTEEVIKSGKPEKKSHGKKAVKGDKIVPGKKGPEGQTVYQGTRKGQYYINKNGKKTYLK